MKEIQQSRNRNYQNDNESLFLLQNYQKYF